MKTKNIREKLIRHINRLILNVWVEVWKDNDNPEITEIICIILEFETGARFMMACAGDGGIFMSKISKKEFIKFRSAPNTYFENLAELSNRILRDVRFEGDKVLLSINGYRLIIFNYDDFLEVNIKKDAC